jgi:hypothetical protein
MGFGDERVISAAGCACAGWEVVAGLRCRISFGWCNWSWCLPELMRRQDLRCSDDVRQFPEMETPTRLCRAQGKRYACWIYILGFNLNGRLILRYDI